MLHGTSSYELLFRDELASCLSLCRLYLFLVISLTLVYCISLSMHDSYLKTTKQFFHIRVPVSRSEFML